MPPVLAASPTPQTRRDRSEPGDLSTLVFPDTEKRVESAAVTAAADLLTSMFLGTQDDRSRAEGRLQQLQDLSNEETRVGTLARRTIKLYHEQMANTLVRGLVSPHEHQAGYAQAMLDQISRGDTAAQLRFLQTGVTEPAARRALSDYLTGMVTHMTARLGEGLRLRNGPLMEYAIDRLSAVLNTAGTDPFHAVRRSIQDPLVATLIDQMMEDQLATIRGPGGNVVHSTERPDSRRARVNEKAVHPSRPGRAAATGSDDPGEIA